MFISNAFDLIPPLYVLQGPATKDYRLKLMSSSEPVSSQVNVLLRTCLICPPSEGQVAFSHASGSFMPVSLGVEISPPQSFHVCAEAFAAQPEPAALATAAIKNQP
jgi:hypothetical protein